MFENHFRWHFWPLQIDRPFWMSEIHFRSQFWPFIFSGHFGRSKITFNRISDHFRSICNLFFDFIFDKMAAGGHLDGTTMSIIELVRDIWMSNACVKFEEHSLNPSKVMALTTKL